MKKLILILTLLSVQAKGQKVLPVYSDTNDCSKTGLHMGCYLDSAGKHTSIPIFTIDSPIDTTLFGLVEWTKSKSFTCIGVRTCKNLNHLNKDYICICDDDGRITVVGDTMKAIQNVIDYYNYAK